jgi:hypothetical protein
VQLQRVVVTEHFLATDATGTALQTTLFQYDKGLSYLNVAASVAPAMVFVLALLALLI